MDTELPVLASWAGATAYDLRLCAAAGLPMLLLCTPDVVAAVELTERLRERTHGAVNCDTESLNGSVSVREFSFGTVGLQGVDDVGHPLDVAYKDIAALIRAV